MSTQFSKNKKHETFFQGLMDDVLYNQGFTTKTEVNLSIKPTKKAIDNLTNFGITYNPDTLTYSSNGVKFVKTKTESNNKKADLLFTLNEKNMIFELKSTYKRTQDGITDAKKNHNQIISYCLGYIMTHNKLPDHVRLLLLSNLATAPMKEHKAIKSLIKEILAPVNQFLSGLGVKIQGQFIIMNDYDDLSVTDILNLTDNPYESNAVYQITT